MKTRNWIPALLALVAAGLLLAACGDDEKSDDKAATTSTQPTVSPSAARRVPRAAADPKARARARLSSVARLRQPKAASRQRANVVGSDRPLPQFLATVSNDAATYWQKVFNASKFAFPKTTQVVIADSAQGACGSITSAEGPPNYCPADQTVYLPVGYFQQKVLPVGDAAVVTLVALLWGYRVQDAVGAFKAVQSGQRTGLDVNLGAMCFAGSYMSTVAGRNLLESGDVDEILKTAVATADQGTPPDVNKAKGTPQQRVAAFRIGFSRGVAACQKIKAS
jgi:predicted metalloprotease